MAVDEYVEEANRGGLRTVYLLVRDIDGQVGVEWGVDWGLKDDEELPEDVEELSDAQYSVWRVIKALEGIDDADYREQLEKQAKDKPSGLLVPAGIKGQN